MARFFLVKSFLYQLKQAETLPTHQPECSVFFRRPEHSGRNTGKVYSPFLASIEEPFTINAQPAEKPPLHKVLLWPVAVVF